MRMSSRMRLLTLVLLGLAAGLPAAAQEKVGVNAAVNTDASGTPPGGAVRRLVIGQEVVHNERITTDAKGQTQILFIDGSSVSVGPNADLVIDEFIYDPATGTGKMTLTELQGAMRFVGGRLSKQENAVTLHIGTSTIGIRGGVFVADVQPGGKTEIVFVYGKELTVSGPSGCSQQLYRPGFAVGIGKAGGCPDNPHQAPPGSTAAILSQLDGSQGKSGGATTVPTNVMVANSALPNTISNNVTVSVQQANAAAPFVATPPTPTVTPPQVPQNQIQITSSQSQSVVANPPTASTPTPAPTPTPTPTPTPPSPTLPGPTPPTTQIAGLAKVAPVGSTAGFTDQSAAARVPYTGSITYPSTTLQNGVAVGNVPNAGAVFSISPLTAGATTNVTGAVTAGSSAGATATGTATETADGDFFYANLIAQDSNQNVFTMGGTPVNQSFYTAQPAAQIFAFQLQPDAALASGSQAQTIPFLPSNFGGTMANASVSNLYIGLGANSPFGMATSTNGYASPKYLQASLALNGTGAGQTSALVIATGEFFSTTGSNNQVAAGGPIAGTVMLSANSSPVHIGSTAATVPDANGNNLFGGNTLDGFVLDQNAYSYNSSTPLALRLASAAQFGSTTASYAFNQPATTTTVPTAVTSATRQNLNETGYVGGLMTFTANTSTAGNPYALLGTTSVATTASNNRAQATFVATDPFTSSQSGINSLVLAFGSNTGGTNGSNGTYINNNIYAATQSPINNSAINGNNLTLPPNNTASAPSPSIAMVTSGTVPDAINSILPAGVTPCSCQYLQWGYWTGQVTSTTSQGLGTNRTDRAYINTWLAGMPTVTMPTSGTGTFTGAAIGTVYNAGNAYVAAGGFSNTYNFANNTGTVMISNFDGVNYTGTAAGSGNAYAAALTGAGTNRSGSAIGTFYGPSAAETGGGFAIHAASGPSYIASGIFAGKR